MKLLIALTLIAAMGLISCGGNKAFTRGSYDDNVDSTNLLNDRWSESDMQNAVKDLVKSASSHYAIRTAKKPPVVMVTGIQNKTEEHIDTQNISDMLRVELMRSASLQFVDKAARDSIADEYKYQNSGMVKGSTKKGPGGQIGADYILNGRLDSIVQQAGRDKTVYYKVTLNLTNLKTSLIVWSDYKQIRKKYHKSRFGL
ncbi:MAG: penicillin-binding protein activator LpoB [Bdellovibrionaceae bacterium]|jgi:penicillin-binding protein activator|nr:penicillin-binding protein activator LpoB [Pseudobdellovibrionaceae bacterium]